MSRIIDFSLNNRFLIIVLWLLVAAVGINSLRDLPIDAVPDVTNIQVQILTNSPGLAPEEVGRFITFPVETSMSGLPAIEEIRSVSKFGLSVVTVVFDEGTELSVSKPPWILASRRSAAAPDSATGRHRLLPTFCDFPADGRYFRR